MSRSMVEQLVGRLGGRGFNSVDTLRKPNAVAGVSNSHHGISTLAGHTRNPAQGSHLSMFPSSMETGSPTDARK